MIHVRSSIDIDAPPTEAFRLLCDPARKAALNPEIAVLHAASITGGPLVVGSRISYRLRTKWGVSEFRCEVTAFEPDRLIETVSDTEPPFRVRQRIEPAGRGCRLVHEEWIAPARGQVQAVAEGEPLDFLHRMLEDAAGFAAPTAQALVDSQDKALSEQMHAALTVWLENIKHHLELRADDTVADAACLAA